VKTKSIKRRNLISGISSYFVLTFAAFFVMIPVLWMISTSMKIEAETITIPPRWIPENPTFAAFIRLWTDYPFAIYFRNSLIIGFMAVIIAVSFSCLVGYGVTRFNFKGKKRFVGFLLLSQMFPSIMMLIPYFQLLTTFNLRDTHIGMTLVYVSFTIPFCSWLMIGFFKTIPLELDQAAIIDGCSRWQAFRIIVLPMTLPGVAAASIYAFITSWNEFMFAQLLTNDPNMLTVPVGIAQFHGFYRIAWNDMMAASTIASIPLLIIFIFLQRYFISGLTAGAVKQ